MTDATDKLRTAAAHLRDAELGEASRLRAADALDKLADDALAAYTRIATWFARGAFAFLAACPALLVAGIWTDWRMSVTGAVSALTGLTLAGMAYFAKEARDE